MFWLDRWRNEIGIECLRSLIKNSPIFKSQAYLLQEPKLQTNDLPGLDKAWLKTSNRL